MNKEQAVKAARNGAIAALVSMLFTLVLMIVAMTQDLHDGIFGLLNDPVNFIDIGLLALFAVGLFFKSRWAAIGVFIYFMFAKVFMMLSTGQIGNIIIPLIMLYFFARAIQGTFVYHRILKSESQNYRANGKWVYYVFIPVIALFVFLLGLGLSTMIGVLPSTEVVEGKKMLESDRALLMEKNILLPQDNVVYFYSHSISSVAEKGNILTDMAVIAYLTNENGELEFYELPLTDVTKVELLQQGNFVDDSVYQVTGRKEDAWLRLFLSVEKGGDVKFIEALKKSSALKE